MEITNKQAIEKLKKYFLKQTPEVVACSLASMLIDINRIYHLSELPPNEREILNIRIQKNVKELHDFLKNNENDSESPLTLIKLNS